MPSGQDAAAEWAASKNKTLELFRQLITRGKVSNCPLPNWISGFVEGEHYNVLIQALRNGRLMPIASMVDASVRDRNKPGALYVYFRIMKSNERVNTMAFGSVGSALTAYKARMVFRPRIWTSSEGGYVCDRDGMGQINTTPFSRQAQQAAFNTIARMGRTARGNSEVGIYGSVSMADLQSVWCIFPFSEARILRHLNQPPQAAPVRSRPALIAAQSILNSSVPIQEAAQKYQDLISYLPHTVDRGVVASGSNNHWIEFS